MDYLDYSRMGGFLRRYFGSPEDTAARMVGVEKEYDSGYFDIVRFFGEDAIDPHDVYIEYFEPCFEFQDRAIARFAHLMAKSFRDEGRLYHGPEIMRVVDCNLKSKPYNMIVQKCTYGAQAGSCFALDHCHHLFEGWGGCLRCYYKRKYPSKELKDNPLAVCLGVCGYLLIEEEQRLYLLQVVRSGKLASLERSAGPSAAGSVDFVRGYGNLADLIDQSMAQEVAEELRLGRDEYAIVPLAYAREIFRGERPQLFCLIRARISREAVRRRLVEIADRREEFDAFEFMELGADNRLPVGVVEGLNHEARMNYYLVEEYFQAGD